MCVESIKKTLLAAGQVSIIYENILYTLTKVVIFGADLTHLKST